MDNKVTSLEELKSYANGEVVELPPFVEGHPLVVRMRRPSLMMLMKKGKIPNQLLATANQLFTASASKGDYQANPDFFIQTLDIMEVLAESALIEPSFQDFKDAGLEFTDEQYMAIFNYTQKGIEALKPFRDEQENSVHTTDV